MESPKKVLVMTEDQLKKFEKDCVNPIPYGYAKGIVTYLRQFLRDEPVSDKNPEPENPEVKK